MQGNNRAKLHIFFLTTTLTPKLLLLIRQKTAYSSIIKTKNEAAAIFVGQPRLFLCLNSSITVHHSSCLYGTEQRADPKYA